MLARALEVAERRHQQRAQQCVPIGFAMDAPTLNEWIEIGERMLANGGAR